MPTCTSISTTNAQAAAATAATKGAQRACRAPPWTQRIVPEHPTHDVHRLAAGSGQGWRREGRKKKEEEKRKKGRTSRAVCGSGQRTDPPKARKPSFKGPHLLFDALLLGTVQCGPGWTAGCSRGLGVKQGQAIRGWSELGQLCLPCGRGNTYGHAAVSARADRVARL